MELITILNRCHRFRGFVYQHAHFSADNSPADSVNSGLLVACLSIQAEFRTVGARSYKLPCDVQINGHFQLHLRPSMMASA